MSFRLTRMLASLAFVGLVPVATSGCGGTCSSYCETYVACIGEDLDAQGCELDDNEDDVVADCENECNEAFDNLTGDEADEADACLTCIFDEVGGADECNDGDFQDALNDCEDECEEDGAEEFGEEFFQDFDVDIQCGNGPPQPGGAAG